MPMILHRVAAPSRWLVLPIAVGVAMARPSGARAQAVPAEVERERGEFARWLATAPTSPYRALAQLPIGPGITIGPDSADAPLAGVGPSRVVERGAAITLHTGDTERPLARDRVVPLGSYRLLATGLPGRSVVTLYGEPKRPAATPTHFPYAERWRLVVALTPPARPATQRLLSPEGTEVEATDAGTISIMVAGRSLPLRVYRIGAPGGEESELEIYFRDDTNRGATYPAGRFVSLIPIDGGRYRLDFNRARNPFCAYSTVYACPAPWRGNTVPVPVEAGEKYLGGGLDPNARPSR